MTRKPVILTTAVFRYRCWRCKRFCNSVKLFSCRRFEHSSIFTSWRDQKLKLWKLTAIGDFFKDGIQLTPPCIPPIRTPGASNYVLFVEISYIYHISYDISTNKTQFDDSYASETPNCQMPPNRPARAFFTVKIQSKTDHVLSTRCFNPTYNIQPSPQGFMKGELVSSQ